MGQLVSFVRHFQNNDEITNALAELEFLYTKNVEKVFRSVDRGFYGNPEEKDKVYWNTTYQWDKIILSPPIIYAVSLESLKLQKGQKFLNIGSGIGYFSTLAGLLLGDTGVNHGIETDQELINLAYEKLEEFKLGAAAIDYFQFCEPVFIQGNACELLQVSYYDRVYCEADVPNTLVESVKSLIVVGGIIVMPFCKSLVKVTRLDDFSYRTDNLVDDITTINLVVPDEWIYNTVKFPSVKPLSLQKLCRSKIRSILCENLPNSIPSKCTSGGDGEESLPGGFLTAFANLETEYDRPITLADEYNYDYVLSKSEESDDNHIESLASAKEQSTNFSQTTYESAKRKLEEPGGYEQNYTSTKTGNPKRMKMLSQNSEDVPSTSSQFDSGLCQSIPSTSITSMFQCSEGSNDNDFNEKRMKYASICISDSDDSDVYDDDVVNDFKQEKYNFIFEYNKNKLSQLLKAKIDLLPLPNPIKCFLNYNRTN